MDDCLGKRYVMVKQENFEDYLLFLGKGILARKAALSLQQEVSLRKVEDAQGKDRYRFTFSSLLASFHMEFVPGEEFDEVRPDGKMKSVIIFDENKMIHVQRDEKGKVATHVREYFHDRMVTITTVDGLDKTVIRYYEIVR